MVAEGRDVKAHMVHQGNHGDARAVAVIYVWITGAVVTCGHEQQPRGMETLVFYASSQLRHAVNIGVHVVNPQYRHLLSENRGKQ